MEKETFKRPLIIDWGIGGIGTVAKLPSEVGFTYFSDAGFTPYGKAEASALRERIELVVAFAVANYGCDCAVIACNAASTVVQQPLIVPSITVVDAAVESVGAFDGRMLGVIGGRLTIESHLYKKRLSGLDLLEVAAQPLSALVEVGITSGAEAETAVAAVVQKLKNIDALLFACTHYPALSPIFREMLPDMTFYDPADALAAKIAASFSADSAGTEKSRASDTPESTSNRLYLTSGDPIAMKSSAASAFNHSLSALNVAI